jgi:hypothetical protein
MRVRDCPAPARARLWQPLPCSSAAQAEFRSHRSYLRSMRRAGDRINLLGAVRSRAGRPCEANGRMVHLAVLIFPASDVRASSSRSSSSMAARASPQRAPTITSSRRSGQSVGGTIDSWSTCEAPAGRGAHLRFVRRRAKLAPYLDTMFPARQSP